MTRRHWAGVIAGSLVLGGCWPHGGEPPEPPEIFFEAASVTPGGCFDPSNRTMIYFADLNSTEGVAGLVFRNTNGITQGFPGAPDANGQFQALLVHQEGTVIAGVFQVVDVNGLLGVDSDPIGPITVADCESTPP